MKQLTAKHPTTNVRIIERFVEGIRYIKVTPQMILPQILEKLRQQFADKPVDISVSNSGWIKVEKTGKDEQMEQMVKQVIKDDELNEENILNKEAEMMRKAGFIVEVKDVG